MSDSGQRMTLTAYAERRGVTKGAVSIAITKGRLVACVGRDEHGRPFIADPDLADREWTRSTDLSKAPSYVREREAARAAAAPPADAGPVAVLGGSLSDNNAAKAYWQAKQAELKFRESARELVPAQDVRSKLEGAFKAARGKLLGLPSRARQRLTTLSDADVLELEALVREALEELAGGERVAA